ncbi:MAG: ATP-dependent Clp protease ATP-binding subunit [Actinobacteria bacterium]|nr:ATP-dependent Clp protease ATP-binding subunit [Actinomycetota bacterium]
MPKINVYLPDELADAVRDAQVPVSAICQAALERAVRDVAALRASDSAPSEQSARGPFERFTPRAHQAIALAEKAAREQPNSQVDTEHLLLGILDEGGNLGLRLLTSLEIEVEDLRTELRASMTASGKVKADKKRLAFSPLAKKALEQTTLEALQLGHNYVGCEHLLLGLVATEEGLASQVLRRMGVELRTTRQAVMTALSGFIHAMANPPKPKSPTSDQAIVEEILRRLESIEQKLA